MNFFHDETFVDTFFQLLSHSVVTIPYFQGKWLFCRSKSFFLKTKGKEEKESANRKIENQVRDKSKMNKIEINIRSI